METPDYLAYKKAKINSKDANIKKVKNENASKIKILLIVFGLSFALCFLFILNITGSIDAKLDIEENNHGVEILDENSPMEQKGSIDKRLESIYNEEIGLSTARAINKKGDEIMDSNTYKEIKNEQEEILKGPKAEQKIEQKAENAAENKEKNAEVNTPEKDSVPMFTRVLVGKYYSLADAQDVQGTIRNTKGFETASPFIRRMGDFYSIQVGSYTNSDIARDIANKLNEAGYSVWVLEN